MSSPSTSGSHGSKHDDGGVVGRRNSSSSSSSSSGTGGSRARGPGPIVVGDRDRNTTGDTCGFYKPERQGTCRKPRSCFDCLNVALEGDKGCVLTPTGACMAMDSYMPLRDYRRNNGTGQVTLAYMNFFPSTNTSYCEPKDAACDRCREIATIDVVAGPSVAANGDGSAAATTLQSIEVHRRFCLGLGGCVCLAACESPKWKINVQEDCSSGGFLPYPANDGYRSLLPVFMIFQVVLIAMVVYRQRMYASRFRRRGVAEGPYNNVDAISSPSNRLELTGWRAQQAQQIQREKAQRGLVSLMSPRAVDEAPADIDGIPELPAAESPVASPRNRPRRCSTDQSDVAMLEDGRSSDLGQRPSYEMIVEEDERKST